MNATVIRQRAWTKEELVQAGFRYYQRQKQLVLARELSAEEAPKTIKAPWATLTAEAGAMICYNAKGPSRLPSIDDFEHWPVQADIFAQDYAPWDTFDKTLSPAQLQLIQAGCNLYYKQAGAWAKRLTMPTYVQSLESPEPILYPPGAWLCIGTKGEPWVQSDDDFLSRYVMDDNE